MRDFDESANLEGGDGGADGGGGDDDDGEDIVVTGQDFQNRNCPISGKSVRASAAARGRASGAGKQGPPRSAHCGPSEPQASPSPGPSRPRALGLAGPAKAARGPHLQPQPRVPPCLACSCACASHLNPLRRNPSAPWPLQVLELTDPVEDAKGYIYDRAAITMHIRQQGGQGWCEAPFPGAGALA
jgi:hypothetical protein